MATHLDAVADETELLADTLKNLDVLTPFNNVGQYASQLSDIADTRAALQPLQLDANVAVSASGEQVIRSTEDPNLPEKPLDEVFDPNLPPDGVAERLAESLTGNELTNITEGIQKPPKNESRLVDAETARTNTAQTESMRPQADAVYGDNMSTPEGQSKFNKHVDDASKKSYNGVVKYAALAGLTYAICDGMAKKLNGCWLVDGKTGERIVKVSGDKGHCGCGGKDPDYQSDSIYKEHARYCQTYCDKLDNAGQLTGNAWAECTDICYCVDKNGKMQEHQYKFEWVSTDAWGVFSSTLGDVGGQVVEITEDALDIIEGAVEGVGSFLEWLKKYWWTFLVAAAVAVIIWACVKYIPKGKKKSSSSSTSSTQSAAATSGAELSGGYGAEHGAYAVTFTRHTSRRS